nr:PREDICTED: uncharacterized protein LOC105678444 [Linepithema humile]
MPRCIVPECASGYDSNKETIHYFYVPKNEAAKKLWQAALERENFIIKPMQPVCEKHFLPGDILWSRITYSEEGNVLSESVPYKTPRLRKGAVPRQHSGIKETQIKDKEEEVSNTHNIENIETYIRERSNNFMPLSFNDIINILDNKQLHIPSHWTYIQYLNDGMRLLAFFLPTCSTIENYKDRYTINPFKEVILKENMTLEINILKKPVTNMPLDMQIHGTIENVEQLRESLFSVDSHNICLGVVNIANEIEDHVQDLAFKDICGRWRHKECLLLIPHLLEVCNFCSGIKDTFAQKPKVVQQRRSNRLKELI